MLDIKQKHVTLQSKKEIQNGAKTIYYQTNRQGFDSMENNPRHKPLLLRGARQVGKSSSVRHLGKQFENFVEVNFERKPQFAQISKET